MALQVSQFSDTSIPFNVAASLCGPAAAIAFARVNGRNPSLKEAQALAQEVGWTADAGMAGPQSQQALLTKMGIDADLSTAPDWNRITQDVQSGKPVIISTPRHYFTASQFDPQRGYFVGASGTDLKGGGAWMTREQIESQGQGVNGSLHLKSVPQDSQRFLEANVDLPGQPQPQVVEKQPDPTDDFLKKQQASSAFARKLAGEVPEVDLPTYALPGLPKVDIGWPKKRYVLGRR